MSTAKPRLPPPTAANPATPDPRDVQRALDTVPPERFPHNLAPDSVRARVGRERFGNPEGNPDVSVVVVRHHAFFQPYKWWRACAESVRGQRGLRAWELVSVFNADNAFSVGEARNEAAARAGAPWLYFLDDDDWLDLDALRVLLEYGNAAYVGADGAAFRVDQVQSGCLNTDANERPYTYTPVAGVGLVRADAFRALGGFRRLDKGDDAEFLARLLETGRTAARCPAPLHGHRLHRAQASRAGKEENGLYDYLDHRGYVTTPSAPPRPPRATPPPAPPPSAGPAEIVAGPDVAEYLDRVRRHMSPEEPPAALAPAARDARVIRHAFGNPGTDPVVSVLVVHHYRVEAWWRQLVDSVRAQRGLRAWELVEVENFDNAFSIGEACNLLVERARAPWVFFVGDDDWLHPDALSVLLDVAEMDGLHRVGCSVAVADAAGRPYGHSDAPVVGLAHADAVRGAGGFTRRRLLEDEEFLRRFAAAGYDTGLQRAPVYYYRLHRGQCSAPIKLESCMYDGLDQYGYVSKADAAPPTGGGA